MLELIDGSGGADSIVGGKSSTDIFGGAGNDTIYGGGRGDGFEITDNERDLLAGGEGADTYFVNYLAAGHVPEGDINLSWWANADVIQDLWSDSTIHVEFDLLFDFRKYHIDPQSNSVLLVHKDRSHHSANLWVDQVGSDAYLYYKIAEPGDVLKVRPVAILEEFDVQANFSNYGDL